MVDSVLQNLWCDESFTERQSAMEDNAIMLPSGCALACVSVVFGIKGDFHQNWLAFLFCKDSYFSWEEFFLLFYYKFSMNDPLSVMIGENIKFIYHTFYHIHIRHL